MIQNEITVNLGDRSYPIYMGRKMLSSFGPILQRRDVSKTIVVITDTHIAPLYLGPVEKHLHHFGFNIVPIIIPPGEREKNLSRAGSIFTKMLKTGIAREDAVIALGGGVIGDLAGFVAATYKRGIQLVQIPTTLLAQVDSSVGGKVGVNHPMGKNMIGAFHQPILVWADAEYLKTLPQRELVCGLGEVVKYGAAFDEKLFAFLEGNLGEVLQLHPEAVSTIQTRCLEIKSRIVSQDERESGVRSLLNLGHTVGHALEAAGNYRLLKHGEAVLFGIVAESYIARELGVIAEDVHRRIIGLIERVPLKSDLRRLKTDDIIRSLKGDKKSVGGRNRFIVSSRIGEAKILEGVDQKLIKASLKYLRTFQENKGQQG